jgi:hypothetical protein
MAKTTKPKTRKPHTAKPAAKASKASKPARAPKAAATPVAPTPPPAAPRWRDLTTDQLRATYREVVGRDTFLDGARLPALEDPRGQGRAPSPSARPRAASTTGRRPAVTIQFDEDLLTELDATADPPTASPSALPYLRDLLRRGLEVRGHAALAARFA